MVIHHFNRPFRDRISDMLIEANNSRTVSEGILKHNAVCEELLDFLEHFDTEEVKESRALLQSAIDEANKTFPIYCDENI